MNPAFKHKIQNTVKSATPTVIVVAKKNRIMSYRKKAASMKARYQK